MITLRQLADRILRDETMDISDCPWSERVVYTGTAPTDLESAKRRRIYDAIATADRDMRQWFHQHSKKTLVERMTFPIGETERPWPLKYMRYIELILDSDGREVVVEGFMAQPRLSLAQYKEFGITGRVPIAPYRLIVTRPGYMKLSAGAGSQTLTFFFIREHSLINNFMTEEDDVANPWTEYLAPGVAASMDNAEYAEAIGLHAEGTLYKGSTKFVCPAATPGNGAIIATTEIPSTVFRTGTMVELWMKLSSLLFESNSILLGTTAMCGVVAVTLPLPVINYGGWMKLALPVDQTYSGIVSVGIRSGTNAAQTFWIDTIVKNDWRDSYPLLAPDEYLDLILPLAARKVLNQDIEREVWKLRDAELQRRLLQFKSSDGSGERQRRLIVKVP